MNAFFTPPSHSTAQLIEASVCLFQLLCFLSSLLPPGAGGRVQPPPALVSCPSLRVRVKGPMFVELPLLLLLLGLVILQFTEIGISFFFF